MTVDASTLGNITLFAIGNVNSTEAPKADSPKQRNVYLSVRYTFVTAEIAVSPTAGPGGGSITLNGSGFTASSSANLSYLNPLTSTWVSIVNNTANHNTGTIHLQP